MQYRFYIAIALVLLAGCSNKQESIRRAIIGDWIPINDGSLEFQFYDGGTFSGRAEGKLTQSGTWVVSPTGAINISLSSGAYSEPATILNGKLSITTPDGNILPLTREADFKPTVPSISERQIAELVYPEYKDECLQRRNLTLYNGGLSPEFIFNGFVWASSLLSSKYQLTSESPGWDGGLSKEYRLLGLSGDDARAQLLGAEIQPLGNFPMAQVIYRESYVPEAAFSSIHIRSTSDGSKIADYIWKYRLTPFASSVKASPYSAYVGTGSSPGAASPDIAETTYHASLVFRGGKWQLGQILND